MRVRKECTLENSWCCSSGQSAASCACLKLENAIVRATTAADGGGIVGEDVEGKALDANSYATTAYCS
jgi:hypothetical protein